MNEKFNKNAKVEKLTKKVGRGVRLIVIGPFVLSLCNQFSTSTFDLRFAFLVPPQSENASYAPVYLRNGQVRSLQNVP